jgi:hypothetical protein
MSNGMKISILSANYIRCALRRAALPSFLLACLAVSPLAHAVVPPPDGGYPGGNTAEGQDALFNLTSGLYNTGLGLFSLRTNTTGSFNTATGAGTLLSNTGDDNTATGAGALLSNTTGIANTATGESALFFNTTGSNNAANGSSALLSNTIGSFNTADGNQAMQNNTTGNRNLASGNAALFANVTGSDNTAVGANTLQSNTDGLGNTALGTFALENNTTGIRNTALGSSAGNNLTTGQDNLDIDNAGMAGESGTIRIGDGAFHSRTFIAAIRGVTTGVGDAIPVVIDSAGQLGTMSSSRRFKKEIKTMDKASEAILGLKPVTFHYKSDGTNTAQFGLIAEEVAAVNPDLVVRDPDGQIYTVRYDAVNAMLLNEFLKGHRKNEEQEATITRLQKQIEELAAGLQRVSAQLEVRKSSPQTVLNDQ